MLLQNQQWYPEVNHYVPNIPHILVGTKVDLRDSETADPHTTQYEPISTDEVLLLAPLPKFDRTWPTDTCLFQGKEMAKSINAAHYIEVSAKLRKGLDKVFKVAVECVQEARGVSNPKEGGSEADVAPVATNNKKKKSKGCLLM